MSFPNRNNTHYNLRENPQKSAKASQPTLPSRTKHETERAIMEPEGSLPEETPDFSTTYENNQVGLPEQDTASLSIHNTPTAYTQTIHCQNQEISLTLQTFLREIKAEIREQREQNKEEMSRMKEEFRNLFNEQDRKMQEKIDSFIEETREEQKTFISNMFISCAEKIETTIAKNTQKTEKELNEKQKIFEHKVYNDLVMVSNNTKENSKTIHILESEINQISTKTDSLQIEMEKIKTNNLPTNAGIQVTCKGNLNETPLPTFNGKNKNPKEFLQKFKNYFQKLQMRQNYNNFVEFKEVLENSLIDSANRWWNMIQNNIDTVEQFEEQFLAKYWNNDIQKGIRRKLEVEKYRINGKMSRTEYFIERVLILQQMTPKMPESDIVTTLSEHFEPRIQDARRVQHVNSITEFEQLLGREDIEERNQQIKDYLTNYQPDDRRGQQSPRRFEERRSEPQRNHPNGQPEQNQHHPRQPRPENFNNRPNQQNRTNNYPRENYNSRPTQNEQMHRPNWNPNYQDQSNPNRYQPRRNFPTREQQETCQSLTMTNSNPHIGPMNENDHHQEN